MELEGALEIIRGLTIASFLLMRKPGLRKMGWLFQDLQLAALPGSDVSIGKLMSVIHSLFIYPLVIYAQCFFLQNVRKESQAMGSWLWVLQTDLVIW